MPLSNVSSPGIGDYGCVTIRGNVGTLIRIGQWLNGDGFHNYEHAFIYVGEGRVIEGRPKGAGYAYLREYRAGNIAWYTCPVEHRMQVMQAAMNLIGTPYSFADYFALAALRFRLPLSSHLLRQYVSDSKHMICSQLVDEAYLRGGVHLFDDGRLSGDVTPADLYHLIVEKESQEK